MNQYESLSMPPPTPPISKTVDYHFSKLATYHPSMFSRLSINQIGLHMMKVFFSKQSWNLSAVISQWKPCASSRHQTNLQSLLPLPPPHPRRVRASITQSISPQTATLQPTTCDSDCGKLWLWHGCVGGEQPKPWADQPTID